jgi:hypothetical protein
MLNNGWEFDLGAETNGWDRGLGVESVNWRLTPLSWGGWLKTVREADEDIRMITRRMNHTIFYGRGYEVF